jgi:hypothetical protein
MAIAPHLAPMTDVWCRLCQRVIPLSAEPDEERM